MRRALGISVLALSVCLLGCLASEDNLAGYGWRCEESADCGDGWQCNGATRQCVAAFRNQNGVFDDKLVLGMTGPIEGAPKVPGAEFIGQAIRDGMLAYWAHINRSGGIHGRRVELKVGNDQYEPSVTEELATEMLVGEDRPVFAMTTAVGAAPSLVVHQIANDNNVLFYAPASGAEDLEEVPPSRYVFNLRPRYSEEIEQLIEYLVGDHGLGIPCENIAVFTSTLDEAGTTYDEIGKGGVIGGGEALRQHCGIDAENLEVVTYPVDTVRVASGVGKLLRWFADPSRVAESDGTIRVGVATMAAFDSGRDIIKTTETAIAALKLNDGDPRQISDYGVFSETEGAQLAKVQIQFGVTSNAGAKLAEQLRGLSGYQTKEGGETVEKRHGAGTICAMPVPLVTSDSTGVRYFRDHMEAYIQELPENQRHSVSIDTFSLESYLSAALLGKALQAHGRDLTTESFIDTMANLSGIDLGVGALFGFSETTHQALKKLWGHQLDENLEFEQIGLLTAED